MDDKTKSTSPYGSLIQNFNRWLLSTFSAEANIEAAQINLRSSDLSSLSLEMPTTVEQVVGIETVTTNTCGSCGFVTTRPATITTIDLAYPNKVRQTPDTREVEG
jgi:PAB-dependent poly(A)-specific ribonuclease subunit 2